MQRPGGDGACDRGRGDQPAVAGAPHMREHRTEDAPDARQVDVYRPVPGVVVELLERDGASDARVRDRDVDAAELRDAAFDERVHLLGVTDVALADDGSAPRCLDRVAY